GQYAAFGRVTSGMDVVDAIAQVEKDGSDMPLEPVVIESIKVIG
ncbi:MAG: peptidylprolyl isomerase, partial [Clostridiales Family XIII bacterium]|nr:peptidylprolyl isomerase [Clostridiales Family XIII bacterium]